MVSRRLSWMLAILVVAGCSRPISQPLPVQFTFKSRKHFSAVVECSAMQSLIRGQKLFALRSYREAAPGATYINSNDTVRLYFVQSWTGTTVVYKALSAPAQMNGDAAQACGG
jgi:hypothetical protein